MSKKKKDEKPKTRLEWVLRCPMCFSSRNDLWLGGKGGLQTRKCLDCGYVGSAFIKVQAEWSPSPGNERESIDRSTDARTPFRGFRIGKLLNHL